MFDAIVRASLANRLFVLIGGLVLMFYGVMTLRTLPVDVFPDLNRPTVTLMTEAHGLAPEEVEQTCHLPSRDCHGRHARRGTRALRHRRRALHRHHRV